VVERATSKEAVMHHALGQQKKKDCQDDREQELCNPERGFPVVHGSACRDITIADLPTVLFWMAGHSCALLGEFLNPSEMFYNTSYFFGTWNEVSIFGTRSQSFKSFVCNVVCNVAA
jgi:hypothetical protein